MHNPPFSLANITVPVGSIVAFAGNIEKYKAGNVPTDFITQPECIGWMLCDGSPINASEYSELYAVLGDLYGSKGSGDDKTFNLPDLRGQFLRGISMDGPSTENRTRAKNGTPNGVGSTQADALLTHTHSYQEPTGIAIAKEGSPAFSTTQLADTGAPNVGSLPKERVSPLETRPVNTFVNYLIKYTYRLPRFDHEIFDRHGIH